MFGFTVMLAFLVICIYAWTMHAVRVVSRMNHARECMLWCRGHRDLGTACSADRGRGAHTSLGRRLCYLAFPAKTERNTSDDQVRPLDENQYAQAPRPPGVLVRIWMPLSPAGSSRSATRRNPERRADRASPLRKAAATKSILFPLRAAAYGRRSGRRSRCSGSPRSTRISMRAPFPYRASRAGPSGPPRSAPARWARGANPPNASRISRVRASWRRCSPPGCSRI